MKGQTTTVSKVKDQNEKSYLCKMAFGLTLIISSLLLFSSVGHANSFERVSVQHSIQSNEQMRHVVGLETFKGQFIGRGELKTHASNLKDLLQKHQIETRNGYIYYPSEIKSAVIKAKFQKALSDDSIKRAAFNDDGGFRN